MFKKLRNKFLLLNLATISIMMLLAFAAIYTVTYRNVKGDIDRELHRLSEFNLKPNQASNASRSDFGNDQPPTDRSVSFTLFTDDQWNIISTFSIFDMDANFFETAKNTVFSKNSNTGTFKQDGTNWAFLVRPQPEGFRIVYLDITSQQGILTNLIYTFVTVASIMLIIIFLISRVFANRSIKPVREAFEKQKQFIADASHELKTPLAVINTNVDVVLSNGEDPVASQSKWLYYIKSEADRMTKLTNNLLYLTQVDYSEYKMILSDFNMSEITENVILTMEAVIYEHDFSLEYSIHPDLTVRGNSEQIQQVLMILLDNAVKYTNPKGNITVSLKGTPNTAVLAITNTGEGIPKEDIPRIFDRFYRLDKSRSRANGGHGLGLSIAQTIIEQNNGKISVKSVLNQQTTFVVELPRVAR